MAIPVFTLAAAPVQHQKGDDENHTQRESKVGHSDDCGPRTCVEIAETSCGGNNYGDKANHGECDRDGDEVGEHTLDTKVAFS